MKYPPLVRHNYTVVSWYTTGYRELNKRLDSSIKSYGIPHVSYFMADAGNWAINCNMMPTVLIEALDQLNTDILYLDSDAILNARPALFDKWPQLEADLGLFYRRDGELLTGTAFYSNNDTVKALLHDWRRALQGTKGGLYEQEALHNLLRPDIRVYRLPPEYCCIYDSMRNEHPGIFPVIEHFQASRTHKAGTA